ncbi:integrase core domain-containing protein [Streptomyces sp. NPDC020096]
MLLRLAYLAVTNTFTLLRLLPMSDREKEMEILALRHQLLVLQREVGKPAFTDTDRAVLAGLLHHLPTDRLRNLLLLVRPDTDLRWHRDLLKRRHAATCVPRRRGRPPTVRSIRALVLRLARENSSWGYRRIHGELAVLGIKVAASTVWEILREHGILPAPERAGTTWSEFLRSQADVLLACDFFETSTLAGARLYVFAVIEHATRRIRILGATAHPTADWMVRLGRNLVMDLEDAGCRARFLIRDRDSKFTAVFDVVLADAGLEIVLCGVRMPRMNSLMERWIQTCRRELLDRTLIWNQSHLLHALREFESFYNERRPHRALGQAAPLRALPAPIADPDQITTLDIHRHDRLSGVLHQYRYAA